jgi:hypothetical protein
VTQDACPASGSPSIIYGETCELYELRPLPGPRQAANQAPGRPESWVGSVRDKVYRHWYIRDSGQNPVWGPRRHPRGRRLLLGLSFPELTHRWAKRTHSLKLSCDFHMHVWRACPPSHAKKRRGKSNREMMDVQLAEVFTTCSIPLGPERSPWPRLGFPWFSSECILSLAGLGLILLSQDPGPLQKLSMYSSISGWRHSSLGEHSTWEMWLSSRKHREANRPHKTSCLWPRLSCFPIPGCHLCVHFQHLERLWFQASESVPGPYCPAWPPATFPERSIMLSHLSFTAASLLPWILGVCEWAQLSFRVKLLSLLFRTTFCLSGQEITSPPGWGVVLLVQEASYGSVRWLSWWGHGCIMWRSGFWIPNTIYKGAHGGSCL